MYETILNILIFMILGYVGFFSLHDRVPKNKQFSGILISIRTLQVIQLILIILLIVDLGIYIVNGDFLILNLPLFNHDFSSVFHYGELLVVTFTIITNVIYLGITQIVLIMIRKMKSNVHFDKEFIVSLRLISHLFVVFVLTSFGLTFFQTGLFVFRFDTVFYYALLIVLIKVFEQAVLVQEDSDLAI